VAVIVGKHQQIRCDDPDKSRRAAFKRTVGLAVGVGGGEKEERTARDKLLVGVAERRAMRLLDQAVRESFTTKAGLKLAIALMIHRHRRSLELRPVNGTIAQLSSVLRARRRAYCAVPSDN